MFKENNVDLICEICNKKFTRSKKSILSQRERGRIHNTCSYKCLSILAGTLRGYKRPVKVTCDKCNKIFFKRISEIKKSKTGHNFCSKSCAASYNNIHKAYGIRRSKLEAYIEQKIKSVYPTLQFNCNDIKTINSELDFYFPSLRFAIELNGIVHYKPIYGINKLNSIKNNDTNKLVLCFYKKIDLMVIPTIYSSLKMFERYWDEIKCAIDDKISGTTSRT
jgi:hypothetical protein